MRRLTVALLIIASFLITPPALAKGVDYAVLTGPGVRPVEIKPSTAAADRRLHALRVETAVNEAMLKELPDVFGAKRPRGKLGPRYRLAWHVPGNPDTWIVQYVYPYAKPRPVVHTPKQRQVAHPGWYRAPSSLKGTLAKLGLPARVGSATNRVHLSPSGTTRSPE
ncbi:hypothetical protein HS041_25365 [Planomonospora sp. ID67723]|uniref:hypothetical protein n=1 Tax=Planomonospora sp. ID67723 TaxID=2738134 RepID=UPI0018C3F9A1|nr:hypothetical protein [Planomonospora sp. ID67723]MBG0831094.1 hypothetical protein [Planomonospora sp. ID67723]